MRPPRTGGSVRLQTVGSKVHSTRQRVAANCAAPPSAIAGQYRTSNSKMLLGGFHSKWWYINVKTFNIPDKWSP